MDRRSCQVKVWSAGCIQDFQKLHCCKCFTVYMLLYECHQFIEGIRRTPGGEKSMAMCLDKEPNQAENMIHDFYQRRRVIFCKLNSLQPVNIVDVMTGKYLKSYLISLLIHSSLPLGWFGSRFHPSMLLSFIWSPHIISHQFDISPATGITAVAPPPSFPFNHILLHLITEAKKLGATFLFMPKCHPCPPWVDYPFRIRRAAAGTDAALFKHIYLFFSSFWHCTYILSPFIALMDKADAFSALTGITSPERFIKRSLLQLCPYLSLRISHYLN